MRYLRYLLNRAIGYCPLRLSLEWDRKLNEILDSHEIIDYSEYSVVLKHKGDSYRVWVANRPYKSHYLSHKNGNPISHQFRPTIKTCIRFDNLILDPLLDKLKKESETEIMNIYK